MNQFSTGVAEHLKFYVYLYLDPLKQGEIFYVGKGTGNRCFHLLSDQAESRKAARIAEIIAAGQKPKIEILAHGLEEEAAFRLEAAIIDLLRPQLLNEIGGWGSLKFGRRDVEELDARYAPQEAKIQERSLLIRINQLYRHDMSAQELYEVTRGVWKMNLELHEPQIAFAVFDGLVREVYIIEGYGPGGTKPYKTRPRENVEDDTRQEFWGALAPEETRQKYLLKSVRHLFPDKSQNPIRYHNC